MESSGELGSKVADLVRVRKEDIVRLRLADQLFERRGESIRGVVLQQRVLDRVNLVEFLRRQLSGKSVNALPQHSRRRGLAELGSKLLPSGQRLERHAIPRPVALLRDYQNAAHMTRTSNLSFSTSLAAASFALPSSICVCLLRCGR